MLLFAPDEYHEPVVVRDELQRGRPGLGELNEPNVRLVRLRLERMCGGDALLLGRVAGARYGSQVVLRPDEAPAPPLLTTGALVDVEVVTAWRQDGNASSLDRRGSAARG
jgi:hypothetical protein